MYLQAWDKLKIIDISVDATLMARESAISNEELDDVFKFLYSFFFSKNWSQSIFSHVDVIFYCKENQLEKKILQNLYIAYHENTLHEQGFETKHVCCYKIN